MPIDVNRVQDSAAFPDKVDVVVIGGGIVGTSTAYELACKGPSVALVDKDMVAGEQSGRNWGWVSRQKPEEVMQVSSSFRYDQMSAFGLHFGARVWVNRGYERCNTAYLTHDILDIPGLRRPLKQERAS